MRRYLLLTVTSILFLILPVNTFAATYYVKPNGNDNLDGRSDATAWKTIGKVNSYSFATGDDVYFKCGGTWTLSSGSQLFIDWGGTSGNYATIGAYYVDGTEVHGVSGNKPIFDGGQTVAPATPWDGIVETNNQSYVAVENLRVINSAGCGIFFYRCNNVSTTNCEVDWVYLSALRYLECNTTLSEYNDLTRWGMRYLSENNWSGGLNNKETMYGTVRYNVVHEGYGEGINFGSQTTVGGGHKAEYNVVYDARASGIYFWNVGDPDAHNVCRYNLVYGTGSSTYYRTTYDGKYYCSPGIYVCDEKTWGHHEDGYIECYGNLVAGNVSAGIYLGFSPLSGGVCTDSVFYNNTIVGCYRGIWIISNRFSNTSIKNNIFWKIGANDTLAVGANPTAADFDYNLWSSEPELSGAKGANDSSYAVPLLSKTSGWQSLAAGELDGSEFALGGNSPAIDAGTRVATEFGNISECDQSEWPSQIVLIDQDNHGSGWEIGADVHFTNTIAQPNAPSGLKIVGGQ